MKKKPNGGTNPYGRSLLISRMMVLGCNILDGSTKADSWTQHTLIDMEDCVIGKEDDT